MFAVTAFGIVSYIPGFSYVSTNETAMIRGRSAIKGTENKIDTTKIDTENIDRVPKLRLSW